MARRPQPPGGRGQAEAPPPGGEGGSPGVGDWRRRLAALAVFGMRPGLERVRALLARLGEPQRAFRAVHVVGSNGKSSTTRYAAAVLGAHGLRAGAYLSPHLRDWTERVLVDGRPVAAAVLGAAVEEALRAAAALPAAVGEATQFEVLTAAAFLALAESGVEAAAVEAGLGGRLDATNVLAAPVVVLTNVALEHTDVLGSTRAAIFAEKAAVIGPGGEAVFGPLGDLEGAAREHCRRVGARARFLRPSDRGRGAAGAAEGEPECPAGDVAVSGGPGEFTVVLRVGEDGAREVVDGLALPTAAPYQRDNAALAVAAARLLLGRLDAAAVRGALARTGVPGRLQVFGERPLRVADGAHNPHGMAALTEALAALSPPRPLVAVVAAMADKDVEGVLATLAPRVEAVVCTQVASERSLGAAALAARLRALQAQGRVAAPPGGPAVTWTRDAHAAVRRAVRLAGPAGTVLVTGSLYLLEELADLLPGGPG